jgi:hypothetical protein
MKPQRHPDPIPLISAPCVTPAVLCPPLQVSHLSLHLNEGGPGASLWNVPGMLVMPSERLITCAQLAMRTDLPCLSCKLRTALSSILQEDILRSGLSRLLLPPKGFSAHCWCLAGDDRHRTPHFARFVNLSSQLLLLLFQQSALHLCSQPSGQKCLLFPASA